MKYQELPQNIESEKAVINVVFFSPNRFIEVIDFLEPKDFYQATHQQIWQAMMTVFKAGQELDVVTVRNEIKKQEVDSGPALEALLDAIQDSVSFGNIMHYAKQVKDKSLLRQIVRTTQSQSYQAQLEDAEPEKVLQELEKEILDIVDNTKEAKPNDSAGINTEIDADIAKIKAEGWKGYETGFPKLDVATGGLIPTQAWIVGAYTGVGKTFFLLQTILNVLEQGAKVILFSTEMDRKMNMLRMLGNVAGLGTINMMRGSLLENEEVEMKKAQDKLRTYGKNLIIYDNIYTLADIRLKAKKSKIVHGLDIIVVDFIQNLRGKESIYDRMSEAAVGLQQLAQELDVTILIGSQVSQSAAGWQSKEAIEFKGAGEIAAIADVALWLQKDKDGDQSLRQVIIRKVRHGAPVRFPVQLTFPSGRMVDFGKALEVENGKDVDDVKQQLKF